MKKIGNSIGLILLLCFLFWLFSYEQSEETEETVIVRIVEVQDKYLIVELNSDYPLCYAVPPDQKTNLSDFEKNDWVAITYPGDVSDVAPIAILNRISKIELVSKGEPD